MAEGAEEVQISFEEDTFVHVYDRRKGADPPKKIKLGGLFTYDAFRERIREEFDIAENTHFVISTTGRIEINNENYENDIDGGDTLYLLQHVNQQLPAPTSEKVDYQPHYDTLIKSGLYEYYASEGQNPLPFAFAELIDNALTATSENLGPRCIELRLYLDEANDQNMIAVIDNGKGMSSKQLNNWAIYRLSKFIRKETKGNVNGEQGETNNESQIRGTRGSAVDAGVPRSLNSDISYFGVGGKQATFFIGQSTKMITKAKNSKDVHELTISKDEFERKEKNREDIYSGYIVNRPAGDEKNMKTPNENLRKIIAEESGKDSFTHVIITDINSEHITYLKNEFKNWTKQLTHTYHYYIHGPQGNQESTPTKPFRPASPFRHIDINVVLFERGKPSKEVNLRDIHDDMQTKYIRMASDSFEFKATVENMGLVEGIIRYHPFLYDKETYPIELGGGYDYDNLDNDDYISQDRPARGTRPVFECYWNGRLIPYTCINEFEWCAVPKRLGSIPVECYNRISGVLWTNDKFQVSTNKLTFMDLANKLMEKNTIFQKVVLGQAHRAKIEKQFTDWLRECHETYDKQIKFSGYRESISRLELTNKRLQSPWAIFKSIEWDGKVFTQGQVVRTIRTNPAVYGSIRRFLLYGHHDGDVYATGGEMELQQEPQCLYNEVKIIPLIKLDRNATDRQIKKYIEDEEGRLPEKLVVNWPEGYAVTNGEKRPAGKIIGAIQAEIMNRRGEAISRLPGTQHATKKLLVELKVISHSHSGDEVIVSHISQHSKWAYWFKKMENVKNLGAHTIHLQVVLNESGQIRHGSKLLPSAKIKFTVTEGQPKKFSIGLLDPPFRVGVPFTIPLELQDEFGHGAKPAADLKPEIEASGLTLEYEGVQVKGNQLLIKNITAEGDVGSHQGKNYTLQVTLPGFEEPTQNLKIRLQPGPAHSIHVPLFDDEHVSVINGKSLEIDVQVLDQGGNVAAQPKLHVVCKFTGAPGLPIYKGDCSNTGKATLTGNAINVKNIKKTQKVNASVELVGFSSVKSVTKSISVIPNTNPCYIDVFFTNKENKQEKLLPQQSVPWTAGEHITGLVYVLYDEAQRQIEIKPDVADKIMVSWNPKNNKEKLLQRKLPDIKVPNAVSENKDCVVRLADGSGLECSFIVKPEAGEPNHIKCTCQGIKKVRLGESLESDITVSVTDKHGNVIKKLPHGALSDLEVTGVGLNTKQLQKKVVKDTGFVLRNIRFDDVTVGTQELCVKYLEFTDYLKVQITAGPPAKLEYVNIDPTQPVSVLNGGQFEESIVLQLLDSAGHATSDGHSRIVVVKDHNLQLPSMALHAKADNSGKVDFGKPIISAPKGIYKLSFKALVGKVTFTSTPLTVQVLPDPRKPVKLHVEYSKSRAYTAGDILPDFDVYVEAEDGSTIMKLPYKNVLLRLWQGSESVIKPPSSAFSFIPDNKKTKNDTPGHFYFRQRRIPEKALPHNIVFQVSGDNQQVLYSNIIHINIQAGPPDKLVADSVPGTPTVSNTQKSHSRSLIKTLKLQLKDKFGNSTGLNVNGKVIARLMGENNKEEVPKLVGKKSTADFSMSKGCVTVQNLVIQENTPGKDGGEYILRIEVNSQQLKGIKIDPYIQPFLFYNDAKKHYRMAQLTRERDTLMNTITTYKGLFETTKQLIAEMKISLNEAVQNARAITSELRKLGLHYNQMQSIQQVTGLIAGCQESRRDVVMQPRRQCMITKYSTNDHDILGKICHLAEVEDNDVARVLSWHMASDMDCVITRTTEKAKEVHRICAGRQQVLSIDSIYLRNLPAADKPLPHVKAQIRGYRPPGNPVFARNLLHFTSDKRACQLVFSQLLGDTIVVDTLDDANAYRQTLVKYCACPTLLTRNGERIRSSGKFGGTQNSALPLEKMGGRVFGAPLPESYYQAGNKIELLENLVIAIQKREEADQDLKDQLDQEKTPEMQEKHRECQESQEQLDLIERKLGMGLTGNSMPPKPRHSLNNNNEPPAKRGRPSVRSVSPTPSSSSTTSSPGSGRGTRRSQQSPSPSPSRQSKRRKP